jgi:hypothetical protein
MRSAVNVTPEKIVRCEKGDELRDRTLESAGVEFIAENGGGPGVRLRKVNT